MATNRRKQLQTNILADQIGNCVSWVRPYVKVAVTIVLVITAVSVLVLYTNHGKVQRKAALWEKFMAITLEGQVAKMDSDLPVAARRPRPEHYRAMAGELDELADGNAGDANAQWIRAAAGHARLSAGMRLIYSDRVEASTFFQQAISGYEGLLGEGLEDNPELDQRVAFALAQAKEGLAASSTDAAIRGKSIQDAKKLYKKVADGGRQRGVGALADARLRILGPLTGSDWTEEKDGVSDDDWVSWLAQQEFPVEEPLPPTGPGAGLPGLPGTTNPLGGPQLLPSQPQTPSGADSGATEQGAEGEEKAEKNTPAEENRPEGTEDKPPASGDSKQSAAEEAGKKPATEAASPETPKGGASPAPPKKP